MQRCLLASLQSVFDKRCASRNPLDVISADRDVRRRGRAARDGGRTNNVQRHCAERYSCGKQKLNAAINDLSTSGQRGLRKISLAVDCADVNIFPRAAMIIRGRLAESVPRLPQLQ